MSSPSGRLAASFLCAGLLASGSLAQRRPEATPTPAPADEGKPSEKKPGGTDEKPPKEEKPSVTRHEIRIDGKPLRYTATAGYMPMKDETGKLKANIFYVAYTKDGGSARRPITFTFNGGPGSSSVWLDLGAVGPKRVLMTDDGRPLPPPYRLVDNDYTWLAFTDLVFIDPVTTGYSRPAPGELRVGPHGLHPQAVAREADRRCRGVLQIGRGGRVNRRDRFARGLAA